MLPSWAQQSGTIELQAGSPDGLPRRFDVGCPFPAPSVAAYEDESSFLLVVYAEGAAQEDVLPFLAHAPASEGWTFSTSEEPDPSAWSLGALRFEREGSPAVALHFYDPSGGDQLRLGEEYGVQGPWIEAQFEVEGFG